MKKLFWQYAFIILVIVLATISIVFLTNTGACVRLHIHVALFWGISLIYLIIIKNDIYSEKIKNLRKQQDITQEKLAAYLNISYQAISKWENGTALPDITLIPQIANFFGVTTDELLGMKDVEETEELKEYENLYFECRRNGEILESIEIARNALKKYPRNYQWMLNLWGC